MSRPDVVPDYCVALTGHRAWRFAESGNKVFLFGIGDGAKFWTPYEAMRATCLTEAKSGGSTWDRADDTFTHLRDGEIVPAPVKGCTCGLWAYKTADAQAVKNHQYVWGTVALWGRVIEHEIGWRSEFAYPMALHAATEDIARKVTLTYGVPCEVTEPITKDDSLSGMWAGINKATFSFWTTPSLYANLFTPNTQYQPMASTYSPWAQEFMRPEPLELIEPTEQELADIAGVKKPVNLSLDKFMKGWHS